MAETDQNIGNLSISAFLTVLLAVEQRTMKQLRVGSLGIIQENNGDNTYDVYLVPRLQDEDQTTCVRCSKFIDAELENQDVVLVLFLDRASWTTLEQLKNGVSQYSLSPLSKTNENVLHSLNYGCIIGKMTR